MCWRCREGQIPEHQSDPQPAYWHDATECRASAIWLLDADSFAPVSETTPIFSEGLVKKGGVKPQIDSPRPPAPPAQAVSETSTPENHSHHGTGESILSKRDLFIAQCVTQWTVIARTFGGFGYGSAWLPTGADFTKSRLFWRLRAGKEPLPHPPPTCYSCPWYEVVEEVSPHWTHDCVVMGPDELIKERTAYIGQCGYGIEKETDGVPEIVTFGPWRFKVWKGAHPKHAEIVGCYIERLP
jgi:hypothetical protein